MGFKWKKNVSNDCSCGNSEKQCANSRACEVVQRGHNTWQPLLLVADGNDGEPPVRLPMWKGSMNIRLGDKKCSGYFSGGGHYKCPDSSEVGWESTCKACRQRDDWFGCVQCSGFEANGPEDLRVVGDNKSTPKMLCNNPKRRDGCSKNMYWVYLSAFDGQLKVGISYERRFFERMIEQGADFGCRLGIIRDGGYARGLEQRVARYLGLPDKIDGALKQSRMFGEPNKSVINIAKAITQLIDAKMFDIKPEIYDFRDYYRIGDLHVRPRPIKIVPGVRLVGRVVATKGNIVVMQTAAGVISFDARRLVGYEVEMHEHARTHLSGGV